MAKDKNSPLTKAEPGSAFSISLSFHIITAGETREKGKGERVCLMKRVITPQKWMEGLWP